LTFLKSDLSYVPPTQRSSAAYLYDPRAEFGASGPAFGQSPIGQGRKSQLQPAFGRPELRLPPFPDGILSESRSGSAKNLPRFFYSAWVPERSLAGFFGCRDIALELVCGADFSLKLTCGAGPGDLGGSRGADSGWESRENRAENLEPDCLQVPSWWFFLADSLPGTCEGGSGRGAGAEALVVQSGGGGTGVCEINAHPGHTK